MLKLLSVLNENEEETEMLKPLSVVDEIEGRSWDVEIRGGQKKNWNPSKIYYQNNSSFKIICIKPNQ